MPSVVPPNRPRRALPSMRPTFLYQPTPRPSHGGAPPCTPDDESDGDRNGCPHDDGARDEGSPFWRYLRAVLEPSALR